MWRHGQAILTSDPAVQWEEDDTGLPKRLSIEPNEGTDNMFYFFYKIIIFSLNTEKDDIQSAHWDNQPYYSRHYRAS